MLNTHYPYVTELRTHINEAVSQSYSLIIWGGFDSSNYSHAIPEVFDSSWAASMSAVYLDEPYDNSGYWTDTKFLQVLGYCKDKGKKLALSGYTVTGFEHCRTLVAQNQSSMLSQIIYMPDKYFNVDTSAQRTFFNSVKTWAIDNNVALSQILPWVSPTCTGGASGCSSTWTHDIICLHHSLGFGGVFIFTDNGINSSHETQMKSAISNCWGFYVSSSENCDLTY